MGRPLEDPVQAATPATLEASPAAERDRVFAGLVASERDRAVALAYHLTGGDRDLALDVAQDAFVRAYRGLERFRGDAAPSTWFLRILVREAASARRRLALLRRLGLARAAAPEPDPVVAVAVDPGLRPDRLADAGAIRRRIGRALDRLPGTQRAVFALVHLEGLTVEESARVLGKAPGTVKSHLHRALVALRRELADLSEGAP